MEGITAAVVVLDLELRVVCANHAFYETFAVVSDAEGQSLFEIGAGALETPAVRRALTDLLDKNIDFTVLEHAAGSPRRILSLTGRRVGWDGGSSRLLVCIDDLTSLRALQAERAQVLEFEMQARFQVEQANRAKEQFLATLSHELRTPLSAILMQAEVLKRMAADIPKLGKSAATIARAATAQANLIDDLLDASRIASGKLQLELDAVDLPELVRDAMERVRPIAEAKSLDLELVIDPSVSFVSGDATRLQKVIANLLSNAIKFTRRGGRVVMRLERLDGRGQITVTDTGMGIRPEVLPHLFERFVQADSTLTRTHGGLGLGLTIVRHLVELHGGEVFAESAGEGKGSSFRVTLPLGTAGPKPGATALRATGDDITHVRVLLVEDDDEARESFATMLGQLGADVRAVSSSGAGLAAFGAFQPQVILCDISMPEEDGYGFIRKVRRLCPEVPAAALTALASDSDRKRAIEAGFQLHLAKPIEAARLVAAVATLAARKPQWTHETLE
jgi:two-component system CheB/CheR fusion protein